MRIIILGDTHLGARGASNHFSEYFNRFFNEVLYPYCETNNVTRILQLGDLFDSRVNLTYKAFHKCRPIWFKKMGDLGIKMDVLLGNHDIAYRHSLEINSPELLLGEYDHINIINKPSQIEIDGLKIDIIPWMCDENETEIKEFVKRKDRGSILLGHLELSGFPLMKGMEAHGGMSSSIFDGYNLVFSGHYHTHSEKGNIVYTGIPYEITWSDHADPKGFFVYDTEKNTYEFVRNPLTMFEKVYYSNGCKTDIQSLKGKIVKVIVNEKKDPVLYERWLDSVRLVSPYELTTIENDITTTGGELDDSIQIEDTATLIGSYIDQIDTSVSKDDLNKYMQHLYFEALTADDTI